MGMKLRMETSRLRKEKWNKDMMMMNQGEMKKRKKNRGIIIRRGIICLQKEYIPKVVETSYGTLTHPSTFGYFDLISLFMIGGTPNKFGVDPTYILDPLTIMLILIKLLFLIDPLPFKWWKIKGRWIDGSVQYPHSLH